MASAAPRRSLSRGRLVVVVVIVLGALGFLLFRGLTNATVYFRTVDQAVAQKAQLGDKRFRIEGTVVAGSVKDQGNRVAFNVEGTNTQVKVVHTGDEPDLFREGIPVVLEGHFSGDTFMSTQMLIKHSENYEAKNPERVKDYQQ